MRSSCQFTQRCARHPTYWPPVATVNNIPSFSCRFSSFAKKYEFTTTTRFHIWLIVVKTDQGVILSQKLSTFNYVVNKRDIRTTPIKIKCNNFKLRILPRISSYSSYEEAFIKLANYILITYTSSSLQYTFIPEKELSSSVIQFSSFSTSIQFL